MAGRLWHNTVVTTPALPIDPLLPGIVQALETHKSAVVTAEPGAGKTTRVPPALLGASFVGDKEVWVLQPRRLAAKLAAMRVAEEMGETVGKKVGYHFRFEKVAGPETRLKFLTDGMLLPLAQADPTLGRVAAVVLDEFHERSLALELGLGFLRRLQLGPRPDLRLLVMSATLDAEALSQYLSGCPVFKSEGRVFPVTVEYLPQPEQPDLSLKVKSAVRQLGSRGLLGTTLVFLPGVGEIRRAAQALEGQGVEVHSLYGDLPVEEQQRALRPTEGRKVILSTNVAETSLTVPGVTAVVDSGLTRQARVSTWSGLESLVTVSASQASAAQRMGRAGRVQAGACLRLYSQFDFEHRAAFDVPELLRSDLAQSVLDLACLGVEDLDAFPWFLKPSAAALEASRILLVKLGATEPPNRLTAVGRKMVRFPLPPRLARFLLKVEELAPKDSATLRGACRLAALVSEEKAGSEDLLEELARYQPGYEARRLEDQLANNLGAGPAKGGRKEIGDQKILAKALLSAFPDRVAKLRGSEGAASRNHRGKSVELVLSGGGSATASDTSLTREHAYFVLVEAQELAGQAKGPHVAGARAQAKARSLCPIEEDWLLDLFPDDLSEEEACQWNNKAGRVEGFKRLQYGQVVLDEKILTAETLGPKAAALLLKQALNAGTQAYADPEELSGFLNRVRFTGEQFEDFPKMDQEFVESTLGELCQGRRSFSDLMEAGLVNALRGKLTPQDLAKLERCAPAQIVLKGRKVTIHYDPGKPPWIESRMQDFFKMREGPKVAEGRVAVVLHLLAPNHRAVQVTSDLAGFWKNHYPGVRQGLMRKYPRHPWPENPIQ